MVTIVGRSEGVVRRKRGGGKLEIAAASNPKGAVGGARGVAQGMRWRLGIGFVGGKRNG